MLPEVDEQAAEELTFSECLPSILAARILQRRVGDFTCSPSAAAGYGDDCLTSRLVMARRVGQSRPKQAEWRTGRPRPEGSGITSPPSRESRGKPSWHLAGSAQLRSNNRGSGEESRDKGDLGT